MTGENIGKITQVIGPVLDIEFQPGKLPPIYNAIRVTTPSLNDTEWNLVVEVVQHIVENTVRCIAMDATEGLVRGTVAVDTGDGILVPVGKGVLGRILKVIGEPVDEGGPVKSEKRYPIHRPSPTFKDQSTKMEVFETGIKVVDLLTPYLKGGRIGLFGGAGVGKTVLIMEL